MRNVNQVLGMNGLFIALLLAFGCNPGAKPSADDTAAKDSVAVAPKPVVVDDPAPVPSLDASYEMMGNMEFVQFCLPYPKEQFTEDYDLAKVKGQHVFVSKDKKAKITYHGMMLATPFDEVYANLVKEAEGKPGAQIQVNTKDTQGCRVSWIAAGNATYIRKWDRSADNETVTATFEYPAEREAEFKPWIEVITAQTTICE